MHTIQVTTCNRCAKVRNLDLVIEVDIVGAVDYMVHMVNMKSGVDFELGFFIFFEPIFCIKDLMC